jgi:hypothetical protein
MNRHFFDDRDPEPKETCHEVELIKKYLYRVEDRLKLFLDLHAHSRQKSIFAYAPKPLNPDLPSFARNEAFSKLLAKMSPIFSLENCDFNTEASKRNCARLGIFNNHNLIDSYTIECSCWGFTFQDQIIQFTVEHLLTFGKSLVLAVAQHLEMLEREPEDPDSGFDVILEDGLAEVHKKKTFAATPAMFDRE